MSSFSSTPAEVAWRVPKPSERGTCLASWRDTFGLDRLVNKHAVSDIITSPRKRGLQNYFKKTSDSLISPNDLLERLQLADSVLESNIELSTDEFRILRHVYSQQHSATAPWKDSVIVTTIMFNSIVRTNTDGSLRLTPRTPQFIASVIKDWKLSSLSHLPPVGNLFQFPQQTFKHLPEKWTDAEEFLCKVLPKMVESPGDFRALWVL
ncbi:hypothetical protein DFJ73DRAFT_857034 [Zopfochytrium polystomum]|nr:hypothetical protein DFJ73DRAFT_857034 [Zopfochytrium polystomum]